VFIDTVPPAGAITLYGQPLVGAKLHVYANYIDRPPVGEPLTVTSGVASLVVRWGDGTVVKLKPGFHRSFHAYRRPGRYVISLLVTDRAGNSSRQVILVVVRKSKPKSKRKTKHPHTPSSHPTGTTGPSQPTGAAAPTQPKGGGR
jgi:hypothetical protein